MALFDDLPDALPEKPSTYGLRWYQQEAKESSEQALRDSDSCLMVMATGLGKTITTAALVADWAGPVLWLTHRDELIQQSSDALRRLTGEYVDIEQGQQRASSSARIVVGSVDTVKRQNRLDRFGRDRFSLVVFDECHVSLAPTYLRAVEFFNAKRFGMTATADRLDGKALGRLYSTVSYKMDIREGIEAGYLVPISAKTVEVKELDISGVSLTAGDLAIGQLDEAMLRAAGGIVEETIRLEPDRIGIVFAPGVKSAELIHKMFEARGKTACFIHAKTDPDERKNLVHRFKRGEIQYLVNCQVATTGFDAPGCSLIVMARPTKSRLLYTQMAGRGTRPLANTVELCTGREENGSRHAAIARSLKPEMVLLDFVGNCGRHSLVSAVDLLGGSYTDAETQRAKRAIKEHGGDIQKALEQARAELRRIAQAAQIAAQSVVKEVDPFGVFHLPDLNEALGMRQPVTLGQYKFLKWMGLTDEEIPRLSKREAGKMIGTANLRRTKGLANYKQLKELASYGCRKVAISEQRAETLLNYYRQSKRAGNVPDPDMVRSLLSA